MVPSWTTSTGQSIYIHRLIYLNCGGIDVVTESNTVLSIKFTATNRVGCQYAAFNSEWLPYSILPQGITLQNEVTLPYCQTLPTTDIFSITLNVTRDLSSYDTRCYYLDDGVNSSKPFNLPTFQGRHPSSLRVNFTYF